MQEALVRQLKQVMIKQKLKDTIKQYMEQTEAERLKSKAKDVSSKTSTDGNPINDFNCSNHCLHLRTLLLHQDPLELACTTPRFL